jgi:hypothetical protein
MRRSMVAAAYDAENLFNVHNRNVGQEGGLFAAMLKHPELKLCLHTGTFVFHYKSSTIPGMGLDANQHDLRETWQRPNVTAPDPEAEGGT